MVAAASAPHLHPASRFLADVFHSFCGAEAAATMPIPMIKPLEFRFERLYVCFQRF